MRIRCRQSPAFSNLTPAMAVFGPHTHKTALQKRAQLAPPLRSELPSGASAHNPWLKPHIKKADKPHETLTDGQKQLEHSAEKEVSYGIDNDACSVWQSAGSICVGVNPVPDYALCKSQSEGCVRFDP